MGFTDKFVIPPARPKETVRVLIDYENKRVLAEYVNPDETVAWATECKKEDS